MNLGSLEMHWLLLFLWFPRFLAFLYIGPWLPQLLARITAKTLIVATLVFQQLFEMSLTVDVSLQRGIVAQAGVRRPTQSTTACQEISDLPKTHPTTFLQ